MNHLHARWLADLSNSLSSLDQAHLLRELRPISGPQGPTLTIQNQNYLQFCTNNYLGLATDPEIIDAARDATARLGTGSGASRLVAGSMDLHHQLESALAAFKGTQAALLFPAGFMANLAVLTTFASEADTIVSDKLNHASLLDAAQYSRAHHRTFPHRNYARAQELLQRVQKPSSALPTINNEPSKIAHSPARPPTRFLVTDSLFSMDGDLADLLAAARTAHAANALLIIDEAHATGVLGEHGRGLAELQGVEEDIALTIGTLSKALGSIGGFVAGPQPVIDTLINRARSFIYTTALPPSASAAALASLKIIQRQPHRRQRVIHLSQRVKSELSAMGFDTGHSASPIIPIILGSSETALHAAAFLREKNIWIPAIRPPTVPPNTARLRLSLMSTHTDAHIEQLLTAMKELRNKL